MNETLRAELLELIARDDAVARKLAEDGSLYDGYHPQMEAQHRRNAARLREIIADHGWPRKSDVGPDGAAAAWRVVQHSIGEPHFMRECAAVMREAVQQGEAEGRDLAFLEDRIRMFEGRPQLYGTQYDWNDAGDAMVPIGGIEDPERVEERRRAIGLGPLEWRRPPPPGEPRPESIAERRAAMDRWAVRAGWKDA